MGLGRYSSELRERALRMYWESNPKPTITQLACQLGVRPEALWTWVRQDEADRRGRGDRSRMDMLEENRRLRRVVEDLRAVNDVLRAASAFFARDLWRDPKKVMNFVDNEGFSVGLVLRVLGIPSSTYYDWRRAVRSRCQRALTDAKLLEVIDEIRGESEHATAYGSPRVWAELSNRGVNVGRKRVERIMRANGRRGGYPRNGSKDGSTRRDSTQVAAPDPCERDSTSNWPGKKWVTDPCGSPRLRKGSEPGWRKEASWE